MSDHVDDPLNRDAGRVVGESRIAALIDAALDAATAGARASRVVRIASDRTRAFQALPGTERLRLVLLTITVALVGHLVMASLLPSRARPMPALTAAVLLGASAAAIAASARSR